jgi:hypothetical protein
VRSSRQASSSLTPTWSGAARFRERREFRRRAGTRCAGRGRRSRRSRPSSRAPPGVGRSRSVLVCLSAGYAVHRWIFGT